MNMLDMNSTAATPADMIHMSFNAFAKADKPLLIHLHGFPAGA